MKAALLTNRYPFCEVDSCQRFATIHTKRCPVHTGPPESPDFNAEAFDREVAAEEAELQQALADAIRTCERAGYVVTPYSEAVSLPERTEP